MAHAAIDFVDKFGREASSTLDPNRRAELGQFMTSSAVSRFMASLFDYWPNRVSLLEPSAGTGALIAAFTDQFFKFSAQTSELSVTAYEIENSLLKYLTATLQIASEDERCSGNISTSKIIERDFIEDGALEMSFGRRPYTHVIMNPPYKKIASDSKHRKLLSEAGIETSNLYSAFLALAVGLCDEGGEIVAIVPRSFCNGTYFRHFRRWLLQRVSIAQLHVFDSRSSAFKSDKVLQENIVIKLIRGGRQQAVKVSISHDDSFADYDEREVPFSRIVSPDDPEQFIHIPTGEAEDKPFLFVSSLSELGLEVSTGPVVDFRVRDHWLDDPNPGAAPLLYAHHFSGGQLAWPRKTKKPNAIWINDATLRWLFPKGWYIVTRRFSSKEERRRVVAYCVDPGDLSYDHYGFENHLNVIHARKSGIDPTVAKGLTAFLNSTALDLQFRSFSGHTQVNATDLRNMKFPAREFLETLGGWADGVGTPGQTEIDSFLDLHNE